MANINEPMLPHLARHIAEWFPELGGRALAVSEATITKENMPTLPLCMVALLSGDVEHIWKNSNGEIKISDDFVAEFMLKTERYKRSDGSETPFWAFYDYQALRDKLFGRLRRYVGPANERIQIVSMDVDSDQFSVNVSFRLKSHTIWEDCYPEDSELDGKPAQVVVNTCVIRTTYCGPAFDTKECDNCEEGK